MRPRSGGDENFAVWRQSRSLRHDGAWGLAWELGSGVASVSNPESCQRELFAPPYHLRERLSRRARHLRLEIRSAEEVLLVYPRGVGRAEALAFLRSRETWVLGKLDELRRSAAARPVPRSLRWDGEDPLLLQGGLRRLLWVPASLRRAELRVEAERVTLFGPAPWTQQPGRRERALQQALLALARREAERLLAAEAERLAVRPAALRLNDPRRQWGSCSAGGRIGLSWRLLLAPPEVFRYVVIHELCHLRHHDHSPRFWALVERQMPDYASHRAWLREQGASLHEWLPVGVLR